MSFNIARDMQFRDFYPAGEVAAHEVLMAFTDDDDATHFREWWDYKGSTIFKKWVDKMNKNPRKV